MSNEDIKKLLDSPVSYDEITTGFPVYLLTDKELNETLLYFNNKSIVTMTTPEREVYKKLRIEKDIRNFDPNLIDDKENPAEFMEYLEDNGLFLSPNLIKDDEKIYLSAAEVQKINLSKPIIKPEAIDNVMKEDIVMMIQFFRWLSTQKRYSRKLDTMVHYNGSSPVPDSSEYKRFLKTYFPIDLAIEYYEGFTPRTMRDIENEVRLYEVFRKTVFRKRNAKKGHFNINKACLLLIELLKEVEKGVIYTIADARFMLDRLDREHYFHGLNDSYITPFSESDEKYLLSILK